jgi:5'-deoxynucleotidase YfbR-like HD superfamily hydrolase
MPKALKKPELARLIEFHKFLLRFQAIERHICYVDKGLTKSENDAEHSFSMTMTAWFIASHFPRQLRIRKNR